VIPRRVKLVAVLAAGVAMRVGASPAPVSLTAAYDGQLAVARPPQTLAAAGVLTQTGHTLAGTIALQADDPTLSGVYLVAGRVVAKRVRILGRNSTGAVLVWHGRVTADGVAGHARVKSGAAKRRGRLVLGRRVSTGDGSNCDAVFSQNQTFFTDQVMAQVLVPVCATCHVAGGQAQATRLRVTLNDPLATARTVAQLIDPAQPSASLILNKPLAIVPHGGGQQVTPGSMHAQILQQWVDIVARAGCAPSSSGGSGSGADLYAQSCAGCHGADARGLAGRPDVRCTVRRLAVAAVRQGRGAAMPALPASTLPDPALNKLLAYVGGLCSGSAADLYAGNCQRCHGATAGGGTGPNIRCSGEFGEALAYGTEGMSAFPELSAHATALANYVHSFCYLGGGSGD
jgi:mono/diheme cytochrome c family protein